VRFTAMMREMARLGVTRVLEIGPGRVLTGLVRRIDPALARGNQSVVEELPDAARFAAAAGA
jgi:malonyl CoA-acyl carrier protein transacylase